MAARNEHGRTPRLLGRWASRRCQRYRSGRRGGLLTRRPAGNGSPGPITRAFNLACGKCFRFSVTTKSASPASAQVQNGESSLSGSASTVRRGSIHSASSRKRLTSRPMTAGRTCNSASTAAYSSRMSAVMSQVNVSCSIQSRKRIALSFAGFTAGLNPATPATSTDVSTTPLSCGRFRGFGDNRKLRLSPPRPDVSDRVENGFLGGAFQIA